MMSRFKKIAVEMRLTTLIGLGCLLFWTSVHSQRVLDNSIIPWQGKHGIVAGAMVDESAFDLDLRYLRMSLRTGFFAGLTIPLQTGIERSPGIQGGLFVFPNPFHSRMDPFLFVRGHATIEESQYRSDIPGNSSMTDRPVGPCARLQAGYGFNVNLGKYLYIHHMLGLGYGWDFVEGQKPLGKVTLVMSGGLGYHVLSHWKNRKAKDRNQPKGPNEIEL
jgi:hypothetical protein